MCLVVLVLGGCGGSDERPDVEDLSTTTEAPLGTLEESVTTSPGAGTPRPTLLPARQHARISTQAADAARAIERWNADLAECLGPSGEGDNAGATCTHAAWEQLFDAMDVAQYELLLLVNRIEPGACHDALTMELDAVHGFLAGATPTNVVWLDERQQPPSRFDLEMIADLVRPVPARMRVAAETVCVS